MVVAALVEDWLFRSKIQAVASRVECDLTFVGARGDWLPELRALRPELIIVDLDRRTGDAAVAIAAMKRDPDLAKVRIVGFVSHVRADLIAEARAAGADQVLARSAFVSRLPDLLAGAPPASPDGSQP